VVDSSGVAHTALVSSLMQSNETFTSEPMISLPFTEVGDPIIRALADVKRLSRAWRRGVAYPCRDAGALARSLRLESAVE